MPSLLDNVLKGFGSSSTVKDYAHASRIFVSESFLRSPKFAHMFYVLFDYKAAGDSDDGLFTPLTKGLQLGALCKSVSLPKYTIDNQVFNAYNRANIVQKKLKYDPVSLKFHDDSADIVREFWYDYMSYFYQDSEHDPALYAQDHKYKARQKDTWGYGLRPFSPFFNSPAPDYHPIKAIRIFSFTQGRFSEYMLINPVITSFKHGEHVAEGSNLLEHEMQVSYEAVKYFKGYVTDDTFGESLLLLYDRTPSSLTAGSTRSVFGPGGLVGTIDSALADLAQGNFAGAFTKINRATQTFKGVNIGELLRTEGIEQVTKAVLTGQNPLSTVNAPNIGDVTNNIAGGISRVNPYLLIAGGGLAVAGATQILGGSSNNIGADTRIAVNRPATPVTDNTTLNRVDYRATSGNEVVATGYQTPTRTPSFPQLTGTSTATIVPGTTGIRELANYSVEELSEELAARQRISLNTSENIVSGVRQGNPQTQPIPPSPNARVLSNNFVVKFAALQNEIDDLVVNTSEDAARLNFLNDRMASLLNNPLYASVVADDPDLLNARQSYIYALQTGSPPLGNSRNTLGFGYITQNEYNNALGRVKTRILSRADDPQSQVINRFDTLRSNLISAGQAGDTDLVLDLIKQFLSFSRESLVLQAFDGIIDTTAFANAYGDWFTKFNLGQVDPVPNIKTFWIT
jgi:hypothetical protein